MVLLLKIVFLLSFHSYFLSVWNHPEEGVALAAVLVVPYPATLCADTVNAYDTPLVRSVIIIDVDAEVATWNPSW